MAAEPGDLSVAVLQDDGGRKVLAVGGELDLDTAPTLREALVAAIYGDGVGEVVLDLARLAFIDSTGLSVVVQAAQRIKAKGGRLVLSRPTDSTYRLLEITGLAATLPVDRS